MEDYSTTTTSGDPTQQLNSLLGGGSGQSLIPDSMMPFLIISFVVINILTIVFMIMWIAGMVRRWKVQTAVLHMQKDMAEIKETLAKQSAPAPAATPIFNEPEKPAQTPQPVAEPLANEPPKPKSDIIASSEPTTPHQIS